MRMIKSALKISRRTSNLACIGEVGHHPLSTTIIPFVLKYFIRLNHFETGSLLHSALMSQSLLPFNTGKTLTYVQFCMNVFNQLKVNVNIHMAEPPSKFSLKVLGSKWKKDLRERYEIYYLSQLNEISQSGQGKMLLYTEVKRTFGYEKYLDLPHSSDLTRIRVSNHWFPIERGRYDVPITPREQRLCILCNEDVGDELHCMLLCKSKQTTAIKEVLIERLTSLSFQFNTMLGDPRALLFYLLKGHDLGLLPFIFTWCKDTNALYKPE